MPRVHFRDQADIDELGRASFLRVCRLTDRSGFLGCVFTVNARGEPIEYSHNRIDTPQPAFWRERDLRRTAVRQLVASLLVAVAQPPAVVLCVAVQSMADVFTLDLEVDCPVCLVPLHGLSPLEQTDDERVSIDSLRWLMDEPRPTSMAVRLVAELERRGLLTEPFERAAAGLREVYPTLVAAPA